MEQPFRDKVVIVTGASSPIGIGASSARRFAELGGSVALAARGREGLEQVARDVEARGAQALVVPTDLTDVAGAKTLIDAVVERFGRIDVLVNNAGYNVRGPVREMDPERMAQIIRVNLIAPMVLTRLALPHLERHAGAVVQVASIAGQFPLDGEASYSASKHGLRAFSFALREELAHSGVRVTVVSPGPVDTGFIRAELDDVPDLVFSAPMSSADDIADLVVRSSLDGKRERTHPLQTGMLARLGALLPQLRRVVVPMMEKKGRAAKERFRARL